MASYVKFELSNEIKDKILEILSAIKSSGKIKKGVNETTKSIESKKAKFVVMAQDVTPEEILVHIPLLCEEKNIPYAYVDERSKLGMAIGIKVSTSCLAIEDAGIANDNLADLLKRIPSLKSKEENKEKSQILEEKKSEDKK